jgi:hypothetical protein
VNRKDAKGRQGQEFLDPEILGTSAYFDLIPHALGGLGVFALPILGIVAHFVEPRQ